MAALRTRLPTAMGGTGVAVPDTSPVSPPPRAEATAQAGGGGLMLKSFVAVVVLPTVALFLYLFFVASNEYVAEARISVRQQDQKQFLNEAMSVFSKLGMAGAVRSSLQDAFVVSNYARSRAIIQDLGGKPFVTNLFSGRKIDWFSRLPVDAPTEDVLKYWNTKVNASVDTPSSIVTIQVRAFTAGDAVLLANSILEASELLVNRISDKSRADALAQAEGELQTAITNLAKARTESTRFRNSTGSVDPVATASSIGLQISKLTMERIEIDTNLNALAGTLSPNSLNTQMQKRRLEAIDAQVAELQAKLTDAANPDSLAAQLATYETLVLNEKFSEKMYEIAQTGYEKARQDRDRQQLFLARVVEPTMPEYPLFPKITLSTIFTFVGCAVLWATLMLLVASVRDHMQS